MSPLLSGLLSAPFAIGALLMRTLASTILKKFGFKKCISLAPIGIFISLMMMSFITKESGYVYICFSGALLGFFTIFLYASNGPLAYVDMPKSLSSSATSIDTTVRQFSMSLAIGLCAFLVLTYLNILNLHSLADIGATQAFHYTFRTLAVLVLFQILISFGIKKSDGDEAAKGA